MPIAAGTRFGPYQVMAPIGEGGMGEVYRATDTRLGRTIALKVLRADALADPAARKRFDREARLVAQIQHPHICVLHDVGFERDTPYLVMELLSGETLAARLRRGPMPAGEALRVAAQIAHALDAAHRHGIVHRDLKPANIMLVGGVDGVDVKLLDFGVARAWPGPVSGTARGEVAGATGVTTVAAVTDAHAVIGTLPYMAPEQLSGQGADARTDLWALGCVLYEMVSGARPFTGQTTAILMGAILEQPPPPLTERAPLTPPQVEHLARRCLEKDPERRWQTARDVAFELDWLRTGGAVGAAPTSPLRRGRAPFVLAAGLGMAGVAALAGVALSTRSASTPVPPGLIRLSIPAPPDATFLGGRSAPYVAISPDARRVAFVPTPFRRSAGIWVRELESAAARAIPETLGATFPFWSPDGTRLGFFADGKLKVVDVRGGPPLTICNAPSARGGTWNQFDEILFTPSLDSGLSIVPANGGAPKVATTLNAERGDVNHKFPSFLPDGRRFLFMNQTASAAETGIYVGAVGAETTRLLDVASRTVFADGFLWYVKDRVLVAHQFDPTTLSLSGAPRPVADEVAGRNTIVGDALFSVASDGTAVLWNGPQAATTELAWFDRTGQRLGGLATPDRYLSIALAPDDRTLAVEVPDPEGPFYNIWTIDTTTGLKSRVTSGSLNWGPVWSPDGTRLAYGSLRGGPSQAFVRSVDGPPAETSVWKSGEFVGPSGWLPDGRSLVLLDATNYRVGILGTAPASTPAWMNNETFVNGDGRVSPDGRWLAYTSNESGTWDVYLRPFPTLDRKWRVSPAGGSGPQWRRDSAELYYIDRDQHLMAVKIKPSSSPVDGQPERLFSLPIVPTPPGIDPRSMFAPTSKGDRFLVNTAAESGSELPLTVVLNLAHHLRISHR